MYGIDAYAGEGELAADATLPALAQGGKDTTPNRRAVILAGRPTDLAGEIERVLTGVKRKPSTSAA